MKRYDYDTYTWYLSEIERFPLLTKKEEQHLLVKYKKDNDREARKRLIESNLRLVVKIEGKYNLKSISSLDLIQAGNEGLINAIDTFDVDRETKLSTYATKCINGYMLNFMKSQLKIEKIPAYKMQELSQYLNVKNVLSNTLERKVKIEDLIKEATFTTEQIEEYERLLQDYVSLVNNFQEEEEGVFVLEDTDFSIDHDIEEESLKLEIRKLLDMSKQLTYKEKMILILKFGLEDGIPRKDREIALELYRLGINDRVLKKEGINFGYQKGLKKLRPLARNRNLQDYLD